MLYFRIFLAIRCLYSNFTTIVRLVEVGSAKASFTDFSLELVLLITDRDDFIVLSSLLLDRISFFS
jgi:hypothetical protein